MKKIIFAAALIILLIFAAQTNPSKKAFVSWAKQELIKKSKNKYLDLGIDLFGDKVISKVTTTNDYTFFSIYEVKYLDNKIRVIGIMNHFIPISKEKIKL